jgi:GPH family glycoside/pentoside/hexuronide:cation symporter
VSSDSNPIGPPAKAQAEAQDEAQDSRHQPISNRVIFGWGLGSLGLATILNTLNVLLLAYLTLVVGLEPALAGSLILMAKLYDVITDLPMGWLSDRTVTPWGARRPYLLAAGFVTPLAMILLFSQPVIDPAQYVLVALLLYATGYTLFNVPYLSMPAELASDTHVRTRMVAYRSAFIAAGTFFGVSVAPYLVGAMGGGAVGYATLGQVMAVVIAIAFFGCFWLTGYSPVPKKLTAAVSVRKQLATIMANRYFLALMAIKITHLLGLAIGAGSLFFFMKYALGYDLKVLGIYGAATTLAWAVSMPMWTRLARTRGKRAGYFVSTLGYLLITLTWLLAKPGEPMSLLLLRAVAFGFVSGGMLLMGNAMLQDIMDRDYRDTGKRKNGLFAGMYSLTEKVTSGIGAQILGAILSATGFSRMAADQPASAIEGIYVAVAVIPAALMLLSLLPIWWYRLDEKQLTA